MAEFDLAIRGGTIATAASTTMATSPRPVRSESRTPTISAPASASRARGPAPTPRSIGDEIVAKAAEEARLCAETHHHRQAQIVPCRHSRAAVSAIHDQGLRANNRAENSHQPVRRRERKQQRFKSPGSAQRFLSIHAAVQNAFYVQRHLLPRRIFKEFRAETFAVWKQSCIAA